MNILGPDDFLDKDYGTTKCKCGAMGTNELQPCPYNEDIYNDPTPCCNCCAACAHECAMDI